MGGRGAGRAAAFNIPPVPEEGFCRVVRDMVFRR